MFSNSENKNGSDYIDKVKEKLFENLRSLPHAPSVQMHDIAPDGITVKDVPKGTSEGNPDVRWVTFYRFFTIRDYRISEEDRDRRVDRDDEFSDSEDEGEGGRRNKEDFKHASS